MGKVEWKVIDEQEVVTLSHGRQEISILPAYGGNWYSWKLDGKELRGGYRFDMPKDLFGTPVLFPTPNRLKNGRYSFEGKDYHMVKDGQTRALHGVILDEPLMSEDWGASENEAHLTLRADFLPGTRLYEMFPFACVFKLTFSLCDLGVKVTYTVENMGEGNLPFGFALHPYFGKLEDEKTIFLHTPADKVYDTDENNFPLGTLRSVVGDADLDLTGWHDVDSLHLDHVYYGLKAGDISALRYEQSGLTIEIEGSDEFSHLVVFTPKDLPGIAVESQTCCTNAVNMYAQGNCPTNGLIILPAGQKHSGHVCFAVREG